MVCTSQKTLRICLTPVRNEAWILERFLQHTSLWADHIIVADQCSDDGSKEIAQRFPKVTLIQNNSPQYDEGARQQLLLEAARRFSAKRLLFALDADEAITANWTYSAEWEALATAPEGTVVCMDWVNIYPNFETCWIPKAPIPYGFVDDGAQHQGPKIHSTRLPAPESANKLAFKEVKLLHFQYVNWERMKSKQRWYQVWERLNFPNKSAITLYRQYHHMDARDPSEMHPFQDEWLRVYEEAGIDMRTFPSEPYYWWDREVVELLLKHGPKPFRKVAIWDVDWQEKARLMGIPAPPQTLADPRTPFEKQVHRWLAATQGRKYDRRVRLLQRALRLFGW